MCFTIDNLSTGLDVMCKHLLNATYPPGGIQSFQTVMGALLVLKESLTLLTVSVMAALLGMTEVVVSSVMNRLRSVLGFTGERKLKLVPKSLPDYLVDEVTNSRYLLNRRNNHERVAGV